MGFLPYVSDILIAKRVAHFFLLIWSCIENHIAVMTSYLCHGKLSNRSSGGTGIVNKLSNSLEVDFVLETIKMLMRNHLYSLNATTIIHSDQGCHYTSVKFRELIKDSNLRQSMSRRGNCWDNAPQESFFGHMKDELAPYIKDWKTINDADERISDWIDFFIQTVIFFAFEFRFFFLGHDFLDLCIHLEF